MPANVIIDLPYIAFSHSGTADLSFLDRLVSYNPIWFGEGTRKYNIRKQQMPKYKANRKRNTEFFERAIAFYRQIKSTYGLDVHQKDGYEGDDLCALEALRSSIVDKKFTLLIGIDKDYLQLPFSVGIFNAFFQSQRYRKRSLSGGKEIVEIVNRYPHLVPAYLAVLGDSADNIPRLLGYRIRGKELVKPILSDSPYRTLYEAYGEPFLDNLQLVTLPHHSLGNIPRSDIVELLDKGEYYEAFL